MSFLLGWEDVDFFGFEALTRRCSSRKLDFMESSFIGKISSSSSTHRMCSN
jgi:hypothetical protein